MSLRTSTAAWFLGLLSSIVGTFVAVRFSLIGLLIYAVLAGALALRTRARAAIGGGMLLATGLWFAYFQYTQANCDAMNATGGLCQMSDTTANTAIVFAFVFAGAALSIYALVLGKRSLRGGE